VLKAPLLASTVVKTRRSPAIKLVPVSVIVCPGVAEPAQVRAGVPLVAVLVIPLRRDSGTLCRRRVS
jgi:hypothetical protein